MAMLVTDKILAAPRGSYEEVRAFYANRSTVKRRDHVDTYLRAIFELAPLAGIDPAIAVAQSCLETGYFTSDWWEYRLNPAGMGVTGDPKQNSASPYFADGRAAARAQLSHLQLYATGKVSYPFVIADNPRYTVYVQNYGNVVRATTIEQLNQKWAMDADNNYHGKLCARGNTIFPTLPASVPAVVKGPVILAPWEGYSTVVFSGTTYYAKRMTVNVSVDTLNVRSNTTTTSTILRTLPLGATLKVFGWVHGELVGSENRWWISENYERVWVGGTTQTP